MINIKQNKNVFLIIILLISLFFTTTVYSAFNTQLQIRGEGVVRSEQTFRISALNLVEATNKAYETYSSRYDQETTSIYATLPASSSMTYEVEVTNKTTDLIYRLAKMIFEVNDNPNVTVKYSIKEGDCIVANSKKKFTITLTNSTSTEQVLTLITRYNFEIADWVPPEVTYLSSHVSSSINENKESDIFEIKVKNLNKYYVDYKLTSDNSLFTIVDDANNSSFQIGPNSTVTHQIRIKLRDNVVFENNEENVKLMLKSTNPFTESIDIKTISITMPQYASIAILNSMEIQDSPENFSNIEDTNGLLLKIDEHSSHTYYFRGVVNNNYFSFADNLWRIVRIDSNGNIRLVLNDNVAPGTHFAHNYICGEVENLEAAMPIVDYEQSNVKQVVEKWYADNIDSKEKEKIYVVPSNFCVDLSYQDPFETQFDRLVYYFKPYLHVGVDANKFTPNFSCPEESILKSNVGLLSAEEVLAAGSYWERFNDKYYLYNPNSTIQTSWTLSASYYSIHEKQAGLIVYNQDNKGLFDWVIGGNPGQTYGYRPVISIKGSVNITGDGTIDNPYQILKKSTQ